MSDRRDRISVPLDENLREFVERVAEREHRSVAGQVLHWVAEVARKSVEQQEHAA